MITGNATGLGRRASHWAWPRPADRYIAAIFFVAWLLIAHFAGKSEFAIAAATALTISASVAYAAFRGDPAKWTRQIAWIVRLAAAVTGWWLFTATPPHVGRLTAVAIFAVLYGLCELAAWRRMLADDHPRM